MPFKITNSLSPKKLLLSKWTAVHPTHQRKHFLVIKVIVPEAPNEMIQFVELEAVFDKRVEQIFNKGNFYLLTFFLAAGALLTCSSIFLSAASAT